MDTLQPGDLYIFITHNGVREPMILIEPIDEFSWRMWDVNAGQIAWDYTSNILTHPCYVRAA